MKHFSEDRAAGCFPAHRKRRASAILTASAEDVSGTGSHSLLAGQIMAGSRNLGMRRAIRMAIEFTDQLTFHFDQTRDSAQVLTIRTPPFRGDVRRAEALLKGFDLRFGNGDHPILRHIVDLSVRYDRQHPNTVLVDATILLRDNSGNVDDPFGGRVEAVVVPETSA